jgi:hypothetical protein
MKERRGQILVGFKCDPALQDEIRAAAKGVPLSQFLREAIVEKLISMNMGVDPALARAPSRIGKGGPKKKPSGEAGSGGGEQPAGKPEGTSGTEGT